MDRLGNSACRIQGIRKSKSEGQAQSEIRGLVSKIHGIWSPEFSEERALKKASHHSLSVKKYAGATYLSAFHKTEMMPRENALSCPLMIACQIQVPMLRALWPHLALSFSWILSNGLYSSFASTILDTACDASSVPEVRNVPMVSLIPTSLSN